MFTARNGKTTELKGTTDANGHGGTAGGVMTYGKRVFLSVTA